MICEMLLIISIFQPIKDVPLVNHDWPSVKSHDLTPECYVNEYVSESDVFSFGLILYDLVTHTPIFWKTMYLCSSKLLAIDSERSIISAFWSFGDAKAHPQMLEVQSLALAEPERCLSSFRGDPVQTDDRCEFIEAVSVCKTCRRLGRNQRRFSHRNTLSFPSIRQPMHEQDAALATVGHAMFSKSLSTEIGNLRLFCPHFSPVESCGKASPDPSLSKQANCDTATFVRSKKHDKATEKSLLTKGMMHYRKA
jgi:hypothetical protein